MFDEKLPEFLQYLSYEKRYSPHTLTAYKGDIIQFRDHLATTFQLTELSAVTHFHVRSWLAHLKGEAQATARTLNRKAASLNAYYRFLRKMGYAERNPMRQLHGQRLPDRLPAYLKEQEAEKLLEEVSFGPGFKGTTDRLICELLYTTGMRRAELLQLKEQDVEWSLKQLRILGKGNKERLVPVSAAMLDTLRDYIAEKQQLKECDRNYLLNMENGKPLYAGYVYRTVTKYIGGVTTLQKKSPHVLRHTFATHLLNNGANIQAIKDLLGHSSLASTQVYTHNNIEQLKEIHQKNHPRG